MHVRIHYENKAHLQAWYHVIVSACDDFTPLCVRAIIYVLRGGMQIYIINLNYTSLFV